MLRGYKFIEARPTADGFEVRLPRAPTDDTPDYDDLADDFRRFAEVARGVVRLDLTCAPWVSGSLAGRMVVVWRALRDRGQLVVVVDHHAADFFRITRLNRILDVWATDPERILIRV